MPLFLVIEVLLTEGPAPVLEQSQSSQVALENFADCSPAGDSNATHFGTSALNGSELIM